VEERQASFLLDGMPLVTGEIDRRTDFETGMAAAHQAWRDGRWEPDRLVHDDQAVMVHVRGWSPHRLRARGHRQHRPPRPRSTGVARVYAVNRPNSVGS
jgi:7,8-dihydropterin-6-yl-methyl-4-(beta-D-ribofuranosyl)aminobenzene 5'-phosphate synthase